MDLLNKVMVVGNLTRDPEVRETANGKTVADLRLAIDQVGGGTGSQEGGRGPDNPEPIYLDVVVWERLAENARQYLNKGSGLLLEGRLQMNSWEDRESGEKRYKLRVVGERMRFLNLASARDERDGAPLRNERRRQAAGR